MKRDNTPEQAWYQCRIGTNCTVQKWIYRIHIYTHSISQTIAYVLEINTKHIYDRIKLYQYVSCHSWRCESKHSCKCTAVLLPKQMYQMFPWVPDKAFDTLLNWFIWTSCTFAMKRKENFQICIIQATFHAKYELHLTQPHKKNIRTYWIATTQWNKSLLHTVRSWNVLTPDN
jgi:hypothetical protein